MADLFRPAAKRRRPARVAICAPTGGGKTFTSMVALRELCGGDVRADGSHRWGVIDTERDSALDYADRFAFLHAPIYPPYAPTRYVERIRAATDAGLEGLLIDSLSHGWFADGGVLDMVDKAKARHGGNKYAAWSEGTPAQNALIDAMLAFPGHLFVTMRSKMDYVQEKDERGNTTIKRVGMAPVQRDGVEYEFQLVCDMDVHHQLVVTKSRCAELADAVVQHPGPDFWRTLHGWLDSGQAPAEREQVDKLLALLNAVDSEEDRIKLKRQFVDCFGKPDDLTVDGFPDALTFVEEHVALLPLHSSAGEGDSEATPLSEADVPPADDPALSLDGSG